MPFNLTTFDAALQAKLNTASVNLSAQDYLLLTKAVAAAIEVSEGVSLLSLKGTANGIAGLDATGNVPISQLLNAIPLQGTNAGKFLKTNGTSTSWETVDAFPSQTSNSGKLLTTNGTSVSWTNSVTLNNATVNDQLNVGSLSAGLRTTDAYTNPMAVFSTNQPDYAQLVIKNTNAGSAASTDYIAYTDDGDDTSGWIDMGITSSTFSDPNFTITGAHDGYIFMEAPVSATGKGNLVLATGGNGTQNRIIFAAGGLQSDNTQMTIIPDTRVHIEIPTQSTSTTTGALTVAGGLGVNGNVNVAGNVAIQGTITFGGGGTTVETANLAVTDPAVFVGTNNQADIVDLAFIGEYAKTVSPITATVNNKALTSNVATLTTASAHTYLAGDIVTITGVDATFNGTYNIIAVPTSTTFTYAKTATNVTSTAVSPTGTSVVNARRKFSGIARDASDGVIKAFRDATTKPTSTVNFSEAGLTFAPFKAGALEVSSATIGSVTNTEIGYLSGVTSSIQSQIDAKLSSTTASSTYLTQSNASSTYLTQSSASSTYLTQSSAATTYAGLNFVLNAQTGTTYTVQTSDNNKLVTLSNISPITLTVPLNSVDAIPVGATIALNNLGAGQVTVVGAGGVTVNATPGLKLRAQYSGAVLTKIATDTWLLTGDLSA